MRYLIIGCGCRGLALAGALRAGGHVVRGTTRDPERQSSIAGSGVEPFVGDPDRVGTLVPALQHVGVLCLLLGSARGEPERLEALHGPRLEMLLTKLIDTTVRGIVYEAAGTIPGPVLGHGADLVRGACERSRIPFALLEADPTDHEAWLAGAVAAVDSIN